MNGPPIINRLVGRTYDDAFSHLEGKIVQHPRFAPASHAPSVFLVDHQSHQSYILWERVEETDFFAHDPT